MDPRSSDLCAQIERRPKAPEARHSPWEEQNIEQVAMKTPRRDLGRWIQMMEVKLQHGYHDVLRLKAIQRAVQAATDKRLYNGYRVGSKSSADYKFIFPMDDFCYTNPRS